MGEWKTQMSLRVSQQFREDWEKWAAKERRVPGTMAASFSSGPLNNSK